MALKPNQRLGPYEILSAIGAGGMGEVNKTQRMETVGDIRIEIIEAPAAPAATGLDGADAPKRTVWRWALFSGLAFLIVAAIAGCAGRNLKSAAPLRPVSRLTITLPPGQRLALGNYFWPALALSPAGSSLAYVAISGGTQQLYLRPLDSLEAKPLPGTEGAVSPFFSPDGQWLGFFADGKLKKVSVSGGAPVTLASAAAARGASWGKRGTILFEPNIEGVIQQLSDAGTAQPMTRFDKGEFSHRWPEFLPDSKAMLFASGGANAGNWATAQVVAQSSTGERRKLIEGGTFPRYALSGHLLYAQAGTLMAVPFDPQRLELTGKAIPVVENVIQSALTGAAQYSISNAGSLAYVAGDVQTAQQRLVWVSRNGTEQPLTVPLHDYQGPRFSPDGQQVAVAMEANDVAAVLGMEQEQQIWLYGLARVTLLRFTFGRETNPVWTPDGQRIAFSSNQDGHWGLFWQLVDGAGELELLTNREYPQYPSSFSADGQLLAFTEQNATTGYDIWVLRLSDRNAQPFLRTPFNETTPRFSPDGLWLTYVSDESGRPEVYVQPYPGPGGKRQVSTEGGSEPLWNRNGRELFYRSGDKMMAVEVTTQPSFTAGKPKMLFAGDYLSAGFPANFVNYDVSADGQRFVMIKNSEKATAVTQINVVLNWFEELKQRVPTGKK